MKKAAPVSSPIRPPMAFPVVCFCSSAGGLTALKDILQNLRVDTGMAFVVVAHRAPETPGLFLELLARITGMPVIEVSEGMLLEPNRIFVMPPRVYLRTCGVLLHLETPSSKLFGNPISISTFLLSLAATLGTRAIAVILSGMASDGSDALAAIKAAGGITFAQSDAQYYSMPQCAIHTGHVDFFMPAASIGKHLSMMGLGSRR